MNDDALRHHLAELLEWGDAHVDMRAALEDFPVEHCAASVPDSPHTPWRLLEHMRIAQSDLLEFCRNPDHVSPAWPDGYWPDAGAGGTPEQWQRSARAFLSDLQDMQKLVKDPQTDLTAEIPHGRGQTFLREVLLTADHNAYHLGELYALCQALRND